LISTLHKSPQHLLSLFQPSVSSPAVPWQWLLTVEILQLHSLRPSCHSRSAEFLSTVCSTIAPALLSLPCRAQLNWLPQFSLYNHSAWTTLKTPFFYCCVGVHFRRNLFTKPLLRNGHLFIRLLHSNSCTCCLFRASCPATGLYATL
jgi:hypothetical protein